MIEILLGLLFNLLVAREVPVISPIGSLDMVRRERLAEHEFSLAKRQEDTFVNHVFAENILLTLAYMRGIVPPGQAVNWQEVNKPFHWVLTLAPNQSVSYHAFRLPKYQSATPLTSLNFNGSEGFLSDGWLMGDGTCHLASLIAWAARDAGLAVEAPVNHNFAPIPEVPKEQGVSIYSQPASPGSSALQNLYIQNTKGQKVELVFDYLGDRLKVEVEENVPGMAAGALGSKL